MGDTHSNLHILILSESSSKLIPNVENILKRSGINNVTFYTELHLADADLIFMDHTFAENNEGLYSKALAYVEKLCILVSIADFDEVNRILSETRGHHLFGLSSPNSLSDIKDFIIYWMEGKRWSTETFSSSSDIVTSASLNTSKGLNEEIENLIKSHDLTKCFSGFESFLVQILNESLFNAFFNAPVDRDKIHLYRTQKRSEPVYMIPGKDVDVSIRSNAKKFIVTVKDYYGSITENDIFEYLPQGIVREKEGGAGIGMHLIFKYAHKCIINVKENISTEFIIVIENDKRFRMYDLKEKSFHLFID